MGFTTSLLTGIGDYADAQNVGKWGGPFQATDTAITIDSLPATPDKGIAISTYPVSDSGGTDSVIGVQFRVRGNPKDRVADKDILDRLFDTFHDLEHTTLGGVPIIRMWRQSGASLGPDSLNRPEHTANYYIQHIRSGTHRED